ncbi:MAG: hypothetical protein KBT72_07590 [Zhongshania sp.]|nr:hypothetical protein [Zhongshania sp.]
MKYLAILALALTPLAGLAASLSIPAGKTYIVGIDQQELVLENLRIGDGARITFSSAVAGWRVQARHTYIGNGVVIEGSGSAGAAGEAGENASTCSDGMAGEHGGGGSDGVEIRLQLGIESLGDMQILANGGDGGDGGAGGDGADAGAACDGDFTGNGGDGGEGGEGGRGGDITFLYQVLAKSISGDDLVKRVRISNEGGAGGNGGDAGSGGAGSVGRYVSKKSLTGNRAWIPGSDGGLAGSPGSAGSAGNPGRTLLDQLILSSEQTVEVRSSATTIVELQRQIERLRARVEKLEAKATEYLCR